MRFQFPILLSFIMFILVLQYAIRKARHKNDNADKRFWAREAEANNVRRKSLDDVEYVAIDFDKLPTDVLTDDEVVKAAALALEGVKRNLEGKEIKKIIVVKNRIVNIVAIQENI